MYIKKKYRRLLQLTDEQFIIPTGFKKFINEQEKLHNLIIKSKDNNCYCTCCGHKFINKAKVNTVIKCPNCRIKLLVKTDRLQRYVFRDNLQLLDKIEDKFVLRTFELYTSYNDCKLSHHITEFMRTFIEDNMCSDFVTSQTHNHFGTIYVSHYSSNSGWKVRNLRWAYRDVIGIVCPYGLEKLLKNTDLKYSQLERYIKNKNDYLDFIRIFTKISHYPSFEFLVKLKLYNLAESADKFVYGKRFEEIIGVPKTFYEFIKKHNLNYRQLEVLRLIKTKNIKLINRLTHINNLEELSRYVNLEKAYYNVLKFNRNREYEYLDYLRACVQLGYSMKDKKILYPRNLIEEHDKAIDLVKVIENEANDKLIKERLKELNKSIYQNNKYIVFPAESVAALFEESRQLNHCVKTYCQRYALSECDIFFLRELSNQDKSLVTVEVKDSNILQARAKYNSNPTKEQLKFLNMWQRKILNKANS